MPSGKFTATFQDIDLKTDGTPQDFLLPISVGKEYHTSGKFKATIIKILEAIIINKGKDNKVVSRCTILVGDKLQRHRLQIEGESPDKAESLSLENGRKWVEDAKKLIFQAACDLGLNLLPKETFISWGFLKDDIKDILDQIFSFEYWDQWLNHENYKEHEKVIKDKYANDHNNDYKGGIDAAKMGFVGLYTNNHIKGFGINNKHSFLRQYDANKAVELSETYIKEELTVLSLKEKELPDDRETIFIYPFKNQPVSLSVISALKCLLREQSPLKFSNVHFESKAKRSPKKKATVSSSQPISVQGSKVQKKLFGCSTKEVEMLLNDNSSLGSSPNSSSESSSINSLDLGSIGNNSSPRATIDIGSNTNSFSSSDEEEHLSEMLDLELEESATETKAGFLQRIKIYLTSSKTTYKSVLWENLARVLESQSIPINDIFELISDILINEQLQVFQMQYLVKFTLSVEVIFNQKIIVENLLQKGKIKGETLERVIDFITAYDKKIKAIQVHQNRTKLSNKEAANNANCNSLSLSPKKALYADTINSSFFSEKITSSTNITINNAMMLETFSSEKENIAANTYKI